jgi:hypothetical protein
VKKLSVHEDPSLLVDAGLKQKVGREEGTRGEAGETGQANLGASERQEWWSSIEVHQQGREEWPLVSACHGSHLILGHSWWSLCQWGWGV